MQLVARNRESRTEVKSFSPVACNSLHEKTYPKITALHSASRGNHSCNKLHATHEIMNTRKVVNNVPCVLRSCIKMYAMECDAKGALNRQAPIIHRGGGWRFLIMLLLRLWVCVCLVPSLVTCGRKFP